MFRSNKSSRPIINVKACGVSFDSLVDTGADISIISEKIFRQIPIASRPPKLPDSKLQLGTACGGSLICRGRYMLPLHVQGRLCLQTVFVVSNLATPAILGIDFIHAHGLTYDGTSRSIKFTSQNAQPASRQESRWEGGVLMLSKATTLPALSTSVVSARGVTANRLIPGNLPMALATAHCEGHPLITGGPALVQLNHQGQTYMRLANAHTHDVTLPRGQVIASIENMMSPAVNLIQPVDPQVVQETVQKEYAARRPPAGPSNEDAAFIRQHMNLNVPVPFRQRYEQLLIKYHDVFSRSKQDLGRSNTLQHEIQLKSNEPVYVKQFKIPDAHREVIEKHVKEWIALGIVEPARSRYNSPMFCVGKKDGTLRLVQDFRALNAASMDDKYTMKDVTECIGEIGRAGSSIFSTLDLTSGFWQMVLHKESRPYTAFTVPGLGQFQWRTSPMGLLGCPASFQRLVELVMHNITNLIIYIDDLLVHTADHETHLQTLEKVFIRLRQHNLKVNLKKCVFGDQNVAYLGFRLTPQGIKPGQDKLKAVRDCTPPTTVKQVRAFLGLCNFFRGHVKNFAQISSALTKLTCKDSTWKRGPLPTPALQAFQELKTVLVSEPVMGYPRRDRPYSLIVDAATGTPDNPGGIGAILSQTDKAGKQIAIAYASRKLQQFEKNYSPFLLEMQAAVWAMDHFHTHLTGRRFTLYTDHKPLEKLNSIHTKTLNRLQLKANEYTFDIKHKKGSEMPADYLSRNVVDAVEIAAVCNEAKSFSPLKLSFPQLALEQQQHPPFLDLKNLLIKQTLPVPSDNLDHQAIDQLQQYRQQLIMLAKHCFIERNVIWRRTTENERPVIQLLVPPSLRPQILAEAHGSILTGHDGINKTLSRIQQSFWWPYMAQHVENHIRSCNRCQKRKPDYSPPPIVSTLPQCSAPNQRIHIDLFGPLKNSEKGNNYIMCMTDAFTKYALLAAIPDKEATTVAKVFFERYICTFSVPTTVVSDQGKEFCNQVFKELATLLKFQHKTTSAYHPQCNAQVEVANKTIAKYLASFVDENTLNWEDYIFPLMLSYNTAIHSATKTSPYELTFAMEPNIPPFQTRTYYGDSYPMESAARLQFLRQKAMEQNLYFKDKYLQYANKNTVAPTFNEGQSVYLTKPTPPGVNRKLYPKYAGPFKIIKKLSDITFELQLSPTRTIVAHASRLKHHISPSARRDLDSKMILNPEKPKDSTDQNESQSKVPAQSNHQTSTHTKQTTSPNRQPIAEHQNLKPPIRRSQRIAERALKDNKGIQQICAVTCKIEKSEIKRSEAIQNIKIPRSNQPLAPRNSVRVDKESIDEKIARLRQLEQQQRRQAEPEQQTGLLNPATVNTKPLWRQPRTQGRSRTEQEVKTRITFNPHTPSAIGAAEFRRQRQQANRQNLLATGQPIIQQVAAVRPAPILRPPVTSVNDSDDVEERINEQVRHRVAAIQQEFNERSANQIAQITEDITNEERRRAAGREEQARLVWETETAELHTQINNLKLQLQTQRGETIDATHQLALQEQQLLAKDHQIELLKALLATPETRGETDPHLAPSAPTEAEEVEIDIDLPEIPRLYPELPTPQTVKPTKSVQWQDLQHGVNRRARSVSPSRKTKLISKLLKRRNSRASLSPTRTTLRSVLKDGSQYRKQRDRSLGRSTRESDASADPTSDSVAVNEDEREESEVRAAFADASTRSRPPPTEPHSRPTTPAEWKPGPWGSPVDDVSDETLEDEEGGPLHPLPEKQLRDSGSPVRVWTAVMPTQNYPLPTLHRQPTADGTKPPSTTIFSPKPTRASKKGEAGEGARKEKAATPAHQPGTPFYGFRPVQPDDSGPGGRKRRAPAPPPTPGEREALDTDRTATPTC